MAASSFARRIRPALEREIARLFPDAKLVDVTAFKADEGDEDTTAKASGYGEPLKLLVRQANGGLERFVFHTATANPFGHDRRADRAAEMLLANDTFGLVPNHVAALDVGAINKDGTDLLPLVDAGEFYLVTGYAPGEIYADDLRALGERGQATQLDIARARHLSRWIVEFRRASPESESEEISSIRYSRALRDLVGSGEGIFGLIDGYPPAVPAAPPERLQALEQQCLDWRWKLRGRRERLRRIHGDFHPFNVVFDKDTELGLLDASRGCFGDSADDVTCMSINYVFFGLEHPKAWQGGYRKLWSTFWDTYLSESQDQEVCRVAAPYLAWRALVICNPVWYPTVSEQTRDRMLSWIERTLSAEEFSPDSADELFA